jgi:signal transduction histidine kinase/CheY-like chemotaxis protein/HPt (histidine-containing phosphotransfer) domain-containing protein
VTPPGETRSGLAWVPMLALVVGLLVDATPLGANLSRPIGDWQLRLAAPHAPPRGVVVVDIDDASLHALRPAFGNWPYRRDVYALVVQTLRAAGAQAVAIDLLLADARDGDAALAREMAAPGAPVVLAAAGMRYAQDDGARVDTTPAVQTGASPALAWPSMALPAATLWPAAGVLPRVGVITTLLDADGRLRRLPLWHQWHGYRLPLLSLAVWRATAPADAPQPPWPLDADGSVAVPFAGTAGEVATLRFAEVARAALGQASLAALRDRVDGRAVFIGASALLADTAMTASGQVTGTQALAQTYAALRDDRLLRPDSAWAQALLLAVALVPAMLTWRRGRAAPPLDAAAAAAGAVAVVGVGLALLLGHRMPAVWAPALLTLLTGYIAAVVAHERWLALAHRQLAYERAVAAAANQAKSEFLANVSHEIRTQMNALLGVAELLADTPLNAEQRRHVQVFRESGQSLQELINDLLDLSKIEAGRFELDPAPFSLRKLVERLMALQRPRAEQKGLRFDLELRADVPDGVRGDAKRLEQALVNLLGNAIKFTSSGSVRLLVERSAGADDDTIAFRVIDTGIGIAPSKLQTVFEPFTQADGSVTRHYGGTGLGLSITRSIARLMGGTIDARSDPGRGSEFGIRVPLPRAELPPVPAPAMSPAALPQRRMPTLLLAEDNEVNVYIFQAMLGDESLRIDVAPNGPTALDLARRRRYDLIFMDIRMPGMDGLTVTRELRRIEAESGRPRVPIVALSANAYESDAQESLAAGCDAHLPKPFAKAQLVDAIARYVPETGGSDEVTAPAQPESEVLDRARALHRLGGDLAQYERLLEHASVFVERWPGEFDTARAQGRRELMRGLARDLARVAEGIGAHALAQAASRLEDRITLAVAPEFVTTAVAEVRAEIAPVIVVLSRADSLR